MEIRINDQYQISSSTYDFTVSTIKVYDEGKNIGEEYLTEKSYYGSFDKALECVFKRRLMKSDATTLGEILSEIKEIRKELQEIFNLGLNLEG